MGKERIHRSGLEKYTIGCVRLMFVIAQFFRLVPFHPVRKSESTIQYHLSTSRLQRIVFYMVEIVLVFMMFVHIYSCILYALANGMNARCAIYVIYALAYLLAVTFSLSNVFYGTNACLLLNTVSSSQSSKLFKDLSWESDQILQLFSIQIFPLATTMSLLGGSVFPLLYPDGPWLLLPKIPLIPETPMILRYLLINPTLEFLNFMVPNLCVIANSYILIIGYTVMKLALRRLR